MPGSEQPHQFDGFESPHYAMCPALGRRARPHPRSSDDEKQNRTAGPLRRSGLGRRRLCSRRRQDHHVLGITPTRLPPTGCASRRPSTWRTIPACRSTSSSIRTATTRCACARPSRPEIRRTSSRARLPVSRILREGLAGRGRSGRVRREHPAGRRRPVRPSGPGGHGVRRASLRRAGRVQHVRAVPQPGDVRGGRPGRIGAVGTVAGARGHVGRVLRPAELGRDAERGRRHRADRLQLVWGWTRSGTPSSSGTSPPSTAAT